jgi:adenylosuccinate lyase
MLELTNSGILREEAYEFVQKAAMKTWETGESFESSVRDDERIVSCLGEEKLAAVFDLDTLLSQIDVIFNRVFS